MSNKDLKKMNGEKRVFAIRLQNARKVSGMSQAELASKMSELQSVCPMMYKGVSSTAIEKYENGVMVPDNDIIMVTIAKALNTNVANLRRPFRVTIGEFDFRKKSKLGKKAVERIKIMARQRIEKYVEVERLLNEEIGCKVDFCHLVVRNRNDARAIAYKLRQEWNMGIGPISNAINLLENHGVKVIEVEEDPELFDGTSSMVDGIPVVVLNANVGDTSNPKHHNTYERRNLTLFHELGHQLMNIAEDIEDKEKENICNAFASEFLIPSDMFIKIFGPKRTGISFFELKDVQREYGISARALMHKASELGVITPSRYKYFNISLNKNPQWRDAIDETAMLPQHSSRFERLVYRALASEVISISKAAELLDKSVSDVLDNFKINTANENNC